jgi:multidrug efflux pump subunit AcrB
MWIVRLALRRPYSVVVLCIIIVVLGVLAVTRMTVDIFPAIDIPVVIAVYQYPGLSAEDMERRVVIVNERGYSTTVNGIQRIESLSIQSIGIIKVFFQPDTTIAAAVAQINAIAQTILRILPPGMQPPVIVQFNASNVPVAQVAMGGEGWSEQQLWDYGLNFIRPRLFTIPGLSIPGPYGGKSPLVAVDIDPRKLAGYNASPNEVVNALLSSNLIIPGGTAKMGDTEYDIRLNSSPDTADEFNNLPIKVLNGAPVRIGDVATVHFGFAPQTNIVRVNGQRSTFLAVLKHPAASTIAVVKAVREKLPGVMAQAPGLQLKVGFDQSVFVRAAVVGVVREAVIATLLVSLMILVFLGSWRSTLVVAVSIPLSILVGLGGLFLTGNTINIMTLGGFALAIGMLVDDATVEVENIHRNRRLGKPLTLAVLDSASQIAVPAIVSTLSICIVFFPVLLLTGAAKYLFIPLALAVVFSMLASYFLSRTLVPMMSRAILGGETHPGPGEPEHPLGPIQRFNRARERAIDRIRDVYFWMLRRVMAQRLFVLVCAAVIIGLSMTLVRYVGEDFFPSVDAGLIRLHVRAPAGTRLEETERRVNEVEAVIREVIPAHDLDSISSNLGLPIFYNLAFVQSDNIGPQDADVLISLHPEHAPTADYIRTLRRELPLRFPGNQFYFQAADIISQVLNFGLAAPIDVQVEGNNFALTYPIAEKIEGMMRNIPGTADVHIGQVMTYPTFRVQVDRLKAAQMGLSQRDVATSMLTSLSSSALFAPNFWLNPKNGVNYFVAVQTPQRQIADLQTLLQSPITPQVGGSIRTGLPGRSNIVTNRPGPVVASRLGDVAEVSRTLRPAVINHYTVQRVIDVLANIDRRDLGGVTADIEKQVATLGKLPPGVAIRVRGQSEAMRSSFTGMGFGLILAIVLVYLLIVVNFQSWLDPFIIIMALPGALAGILWMLAVTGSTLNVSSFMGSIMAVGVAVANSILIVNFANDMRREGLSAFEAALEAGRVRFRPVIMTALAMIIGMLPMALGLGEGGEQNAPLGRAVIGGLLAATVTTLFVVPIVYSLLRRKPPVSHELDARFAREIGQRLEPDTL